MLSTRTQYLYFTLPNSRNRLSILRSKERYESIHCNQSRREIRPRPGTMCYGETQQEILECQSRTMKNTRFSLTNMDGTSHTTVTMHRRGRCGAGRWPLLAATVRTSLEKPKPIVSDSHHHFRVDALQHRPAKYAVGSVKPGAATAPQPSMNKKKSCGPPPLWGNLVCREK